MSPNIIFSISVTFFKDKRKLPPCITNGSYSPHLRLENDDEYLGVTFIDGTECHFDEVVSASVLPMYDGIDYSKLQVSKKFFVMEGANIVGEGIVNRVSKYDKI